MYFFLFLGNFAKHLSIPSTFSKLVWSWIYLFWWSIWGVPFLYQGMWLLLIDMKRILKVRTGNAILVHVYIHIVSPLNQMVLQYTITMEPMGTFPSHLRLRWTAKYTIPQSHLLLVKAPFSQFLVVKLNPIFTSCIRLPFFYPGMDMTWSKRGSEVFRPHARKKRRWAQQVIFWDTHNTLGVSEFWWHLWGSEGFKEIWLFIFPTTW